MYELFFYTLTLFCRTRNPHLVIPKFSSSSIFCLTCFETPASSTRVHLVIPKFRCMQKLPPHPKSVPQPRHTKSPFYPLAINEAPHRGVKTGGGTLVTYPTFQTSASLSLAPPSPFTSHSYTEAAKTRETPRSSVGLPTAAQPETLPRLRRPPQQLAVPHPPHRMRIRCRSRRPTGSAAPSSTSKELPRRLPRLSRHLNPHSTGWTHFPGSCPASAKQYAATRPRLNREVSTPD